MRSVRFSVRFFLTLAWGATLGAILWADTVPATVVQGADGRYYPASVNGQVMPSINATDVAASTVPVPVSIIPVEVSSPVTSITQVAALPKVWPQSYIYFTLPGGVHLTTPWSAAIVAEGYDFVGRESITQGYIPFVQWWKLTGIFGGGIDAKGNGSPLGGGIVNLATIPLGTSSDFHLALTGGYNFNTQKIMVVASGSVQFLK